MERIFISYKRDDKEKVFPIKDYIEKNVGETCWIDLDGIESDAQFKSVIRRAVNNAVIFLFIYSNAHTKIKEEDRWDLPLTDCAFDFVPNFVFGLGHSQKIAGIPIFDYGITFSYSLAYYKYHRDEYIPDTKYFRIAFDFIYKI